MIESERLYLRRWQPGDAEPFAQLNFDPDVMEFLLKPSSRDQIDAMIGRMEAHISEHGFGYWAVELKHSGEFIGFTGLSRPSYQAPFTPCVEVGWRIAKAHWGRGYASEAARAALRFGFVEKNLEEIVALTVPANVRSIAVMEKLGMTRNPADDFDHPLVPPGHALLRHVLYRIKRDEFLSHL